MVSNAAEKRCSNLSGNVIKAQYSLMMAHLRAALPPSRYGRQSKSPTPDQTNKEESKI